MTLSHTILLRFCFIVRIVSSDVGKEISHFHAHVSSFVFVLCQWSVFLDTTRYSHFPKNLLGKRYSSIQLLKVYDTAWQFKRFIATCNFCPKIGNGNMHSSFRNWHKKWRKQHRYLLLELTFNHKWKKKILINYFLLQKKLWVFFQSSDLLLI